MFAEMKRSMEDRPAQQVMETSTSSASTSQPQTISCCLFFPLCVFSEISFANTPRQLNRITSHFLPSFCVSSIELQVFLHCFRDISLFWVPMFSLWVIHSQSSLYTLPLVSNNSHPQNINFSSFDNILSSTYYEPGTVFMLLKRELAHLTSVTTSVRMCWTWDAKSGSAILAQ